MLVSALLQINGGYMRMAGQNHNPVDPMQMALEVTALKGQVDSLRNKVEDGFTGLASTLENIRADYREVNRSMSEVARHQQAMEAHSEGLTRAFKAIERVAADFRTWKDTHEIANNAVAEKVMLFKGSLKGAAVLVGLIFILCGALVSSVIYNYKLELEGMNREIKVLEERRNEDHGDFRRRIEDLEKKFRP